jgi:hypothetical protein
VAIGLLVAVTVLGAAFASVRLRSLSVASAE